MGYDIRWRTTDPNEAEAVAALQAEFRAACDSRDNLPKSEAGTPNMARIKAGASIDSHEAYDGRTPRWIAAQDQVHAAYQAMRAAEQSYFRFSASGLMPYLDLMMHLGMAFEDDPCPEFPKPEALGTTWDDVAALENLGDYPDQVWTDSALVAALKAKEAVDAVLAFHGRMDTPGIPEHKFSTNDGWHILPAEAEAAVRIWRKFTEDEGEEKALAVAGEHVPDVHYWLKWIACLAGAARHGGCEVH